MRSPHPARSIKAMMRNACTNKLGPRFDLFVCLFVGNSETTKKDTVRNKFDLIDLVESSPIPTPLHVWTIDKSKKYIKVERERKK